jgi:hypothetical protein
VCFNEQQVIRNRKPSEIWDDLRYLCRGERVRRRLVKQYCQAQAGCLTGTLTGGKGIIGRAGFPALISLISSARQANSTCDLWRISSLSGPPVRRSNSLATLWDTIFRQPKQRVLWQPMTSTRWPESATLALIQSGRSRRQAKRESHFAEFPQH